MDLNLRRKLHAQLKKKKDRPKTKRFCVNCRNHGLREEVTGHKNNCPFQLCACECCPLATLVKVVSLKERKFHKELDRRVTEQFQTESNRLDESVADAAYNNQVVNGEIQDEIGQKENREEFRENGNEITSEDLFLDGIIGAEDKADFILGDFDDFLQLDFSMNEDEQVWSESTIFL